MRTRVYTQRASAKGDVCSQHNTVRLLPRSSFAAWKAAKVVHSKPMPLTKRHADVAGPATRRICAKPPVQYMPAHKQM